MLEQTIRLVTAMFIAGAPIAYALLEQTTAHSIRTSRYSSLSAVVITTVSFPVMALINGREVITRVLPVISAVAPWLLKPGTEATSVSDTIVEPSIL